MSEGHSIERQCLQGEILQRRIRTPRRLAQPKPANALPAAECRAQREGLGWSMQELATRSGFPVTTLTEFEGGHRTLGLSAQVALRRILRKGARATHG